MLPEIKKEDLPEEDQHLLDELGNYKALDALKDSDGGKFLIKNLRESIVSEVSTLVAGYRDMPEVELRARLAKLAAYIPLVQTLVRAKLNAEGLQEDLIKLTE